MKPAITQEELLTELSAAPIKFVIGAGALAFPVLPVRSSLTGERACYIGIRELEKPGEVGAPNAENAKGRTNITFIAINKAGLEVLKKQVELAISTFDEPEEAAQ